MKRVVSNLFPMVLVLLISCGGEENKVVERTGEPSSTRDTAGPSTFASPGRASQKGDVMPAYSAYELDGGTWRLDEEKGVTMLNLWATWCGPCRYEIPALIDLQREFGEEGLQVVGVSMDRSGMEAQIRTFVKDAGINYKIVHDPRAHLADVFETTIIPTTALIDREGKIVWFHAGIVSGDDPELREALESLLGEDSSQL